MKTSLSRFRIQTDLASKTLVICLGFILFSGTYVGSEELILEYKDPKTVSAGELLYRDHCASCHGLELQGENASWFQANSDGTYPAPPHDDTGHTWHHSENLLFEMTKFGVAAAMGQSETASNMPAFSEVLSDREIIEVLSFIKSRWSEKNQRFNDLATKPMDISPIKLPPSPIIDPLRDQ